MKEGFLLNIFIDSRKLIGVYESASAATAARNRLAKTEGFKNQPEGFEIVAYPLGKDRWTDGYVTMLGDEEVV